MWGTGQLFPGIFICLTCKEAGNISGDNIVILEGFVNGAEPVCAIMDSKKSRGGLIMANSLIQFREEDSKRIKASRICEQLGTDLISYLRICIDRLNIEEGFPFGMTIKKKIILETQP